MTPAHGTSLGRFSWDAALLLDDQLHEDERPIRESAREFAALERASRIEQAYLREETDPAIFRRMGEAGLLGVTLPEHYGGVGASYVAYGLVAREVECVDSGFRSMLSVQSSLAMIPIYASRHARGQRHPDWLRRHAPRRQSGNRQHLRRGP